MALTRYFITARTARSEKNPSTPLRSLRELRYAKDPAAALRSLRELRYAAA